MTAPNNQPAPEGFRRLSSKWLERNPLPVDGMACSKHYPHSLIPSVWRGKPVPKWSSVAYLYYTARTDLPREAYADDEIRPMTVDERKALDEFTMAELRIDPGAEVASERAKVKAPTLDQYCGQPEGSFATFVKEATPYALEKLAERDAARSELATLRAQLEAKEAELKTATKERDVAIHERECVHSLWDEILLLCGYEKGKGYPGIVGAVSVVVEQRNEARSERDKLRAEVEELEAQVERKSDAALGYAQENTRLTSDLDAVRKAKIDADDLEFQIAADLESALIDGEIAPEKYVAENRKTIRQLIDRAIARVLTPSQQPDNFDSSSTEGRAEHVANRCGVTMPERGSSENQASPAVNPSRPEPVKAGELDLKAFIADAIMAQIAEARRWEDHYKTDPDGKIDRGFWEGKARAYEECLSLITDAIAPEGKATEGEG